MKAGGVMVKIYATTAVMKKTVRNGALIINATHRELIRIMICISLGPKIYIFKYSPEEKMF